MGLMDIGEGMSLSPFSGRLIGANQEPVEEQLGRLGSWVDKADAVLIGAGSGLSTAAGLTYSGARFRKYFGDFAKAYGISDIYSGGFYPFPDKETTWAWWSRHIYVNRYVDPPKSVYSDLLDVVRGRDYFVLTTNVDHQFQRAGFDKGRLFYTQGDYGLLQSTNPESRRTYDNEELVLRMMEAQGFVRDASGVFQPPAEGRLLMRIPAELIPKCPDDGADMTMNLRSDDTFVQDEGWYRARERYHHFVEEHEGCRVLLWELGVGMNTPVIIKFPFWRETLDNRNARYACVNYGQAYGPSEIADRSLLMGADIAQVLAKLKRMLGHSRTDYCGRGMS
ncbi:MAG: SIR2 family NAD-dependent protein deacylase [Eggerthellaceae bacterium]|jgi:NAD-dependent SIR2 family protein deacetylase